MIEQPKLFGDAKTREKLSTNLTTRRHPIHRWFNFIAGFSPEFVSGCIDEAGLESEDVLIDPFAGLSTTLLQANFKGVRSIGFEAHPFFYDISQAKLFPPSDLQQVNTIESLCGSGVEPYAGPLTDVWTQDAANFLQKLITETDLRFLASALLLQDFVESVEIPLYRLVVSRVLELTAKSQTDGIYKAPTTEKKSTPYEIAFKKVCDEIRSDISAMGRNLESKAVLYPTSSENMSTVESESCSLCITSPPYLNNFDFAEMTRMELYFWRYAGSWKEITERVRRKLIINTTTAPTDLKREQDLYSGMLSVGFRRQIDPLVDDLEQQKHKRARKKDYYRLIYPYFAQMQTVFRELRRVLKPDSDIHIIVADAALYGVHLQTEKLLAELMEENGLQVLEVQNLRSRGGRWKLEKRQGANKSLGEFRIHARRI